MELSDERKELENRIFQNIEELENELENLLKRFSLASGRLEREEPGAARTVPEDKTLEQDLVQIAADLRRAHNWMDSTMKDYQDLLDIIERDRDNADKTGEGETE